MKNLIGVNQITPGFIKEILNGAEKIEKKLQAGKILSGLKGKIVACLFFEPSTRTRLSFEAAALKMGAQVISMENGSASSSAYKGESVEDTIRIVQSYSDLIVMRHPAAGMAKAAAKVAKVPFINAGDGGNEHPTQALLDVYTVWKRFGRLWGLKIAIGFDPKHSRTERSFCRLMMLYPKNKFTFVCPKGLEPGLDLLKDLKQQKAEYKIIRDIKPALESDIFYTNRLQEERFKDPKEFERLRYIYCLMPALLKHKKVLIMNPLPRIDEVSREIDNLPNAIYFEQAKNGLYVRMALLEMFCK